MSCKKTCFFYYCMLGRPLQKRGLTLQNDYR